MIKLTSLFTVFVLAASAFLAACGGGPVAYDYDEFDQPCYANQQPNYQDGDYYIFNCGDRYRRVRRDRIMYVNNPVYIPVITDRDRDSVYRTMPKTTRASGVTRTTGVPSTSSPSTTGSGVTRTTGSGVTRTTTSSPSSPSRTTTTSPSRSTSVTRSTSSRR